MSFGGLITCYLLEKGVKEKASFAVINPIDRINPASTRRSRGQLKRLKAPVLERGEPSGGLVQEEGGPSQEPPPHETHPQRLADDYSLRLLYELVRKKQERHETMFEELIRKMKERQEAMFEELKMRQKVIYSGVMKMCDHYRELDQKVDQLLTHQMKNHHNHHKKLVNLLGLS